MKMRNKIEQLYLMKFFFGHQTENSQLNMKISGMERKSSGKRDAFLTQPKGKKEKMKSPANVCFSKVYFIEFLNYVIAWKHTTSNWKKMLLKTEKRWDCRRIWNWSRMTMLGWHDNLEALGEDFFFVKLGQHNT